MSHYFDPRPTSASRPAEVRWRLPDGEFTLQTDRGVFGYGAADPGTKLLLLSVPPPPAEGDLLDLGCGAGPVAITLARRSPRATVWAVDVNERARHLTRRNAEVNGLSNVVVAAPEEVPATLRFGTIWSNPPIRIGKQALHDLLLTWLGRLRDNGAAYLVVHQHLGADSLRRWLDQQGWPTRRVALGAGYRVLEVRRPGGESPSDPLK